MNVEEIRDRVKEIEVVAHKHDDEQAHLLEDDLWENVLRWIALGGEAAVDCAREALVTQQLDFSRWRA